MGGGVPEILIRPETAVDVDDIRTINIEAFRDHPASRQTEHLIVEALRAEGALDVSLVAVVGERVVGHIAFSKADVGDPKDLWFLLGPLAVLPGHQKQGVGSALVLAGVEALRGRGASGCVLVGNPGFYGRFGFRAFPGLEYEGVPGEYVLGLPFTDQAPSGRVIANEAFAVEPAPGEEPASPGVPE